MRAPVLSLAVLLITVSALGGWCCVCFAPVCAQTSVCSLFFSCSVGVQAAQFCSWNGYDLSSLSADTSVTIGGIIYRAMICGQVGQVCSTPTRVLSGAPNACCVCIWWAGLSRCRNRVVRARCVHTRRTRRSSKTCFPSGTRAARGRRSAKSSRRWECRSPSATAIRAAAADASR